MYFNIQRFSTHDGDGIRSILFLKGCSLACRWCQNPESRARHPQLMMDQRLCMEECELCTLATPAITKHDDIVLINRRKISTEDLITLHDLCPSQALTVCGKEADEEQLFEELMKDLPFYQQSGGGVTFSGGEPLMQSELVRSVSQKLVEREVNIAIETCMHVPWKNIGPLTPLVDCWLTDLKHTDEKKFSEWAEGSLKRILTNFEKLAPLAKRLVIRVPVVPGFNDTEAELKAIVDFAQSLPGCQEIHLLPYHTLGINKYRLLDMPYQCATTPLNKPELLERIKDYASVNVTIRG